MQKEIKCKICGTIKSSENELQESFIKFGLWDVMLNKGWLYVEGNWYCPTCFWENWDKIEEIEGEK